MKWWQVTWKLFPWLMAKGQQPLKVHESLFDNPKDAEAYCDEIWALHKGTYRVVMYTEVLELEPTGAKAGSK